MVLKVTYHHSLDNNLLKYHFTFFSKCDTLAVDCNSINYVICLNRPNRKGIRMYKRIVCSLLLLASLASLHAADRRLELLRYENHYALSDGMHEKAIRPELISKPLRSLDPSKLASLLKTGKAYVKIDQCDDGELTMELKPRCPGGGPGGAFAGAVIGQIGVTGATLLCGWTVLYGTKAVIYVYAGKEAAQEFDNHIVQESLPRLYRVAENIGQAAGGVGAVVGGLSPLP